MCNSQHLPPQRTFHRLRFFYASTPTAPSRHLGPAPVPWGPLRSPPPPHGAGESFHPDFQDLILLSWPFVVTTTQLSMYIDVPNCEQHSSVAVLVCLVLGSMISTKNFDHVAIALTMHDVLGYLLRPWTHAPINDSVNTSHFFVHTSISR